MKLFAQRYIESDGSITLSLEEIDLAENAPTEDEALNNLTEALLEYAEDFISDIKYWGAAKNRSEHLYYVKEINNINNMDRVRATIYVKE